MAKVHVLTAHSHTPLDLAERVLAGLPIREADAPPSGGLHFPQLEALGRQQVGASVGESGVLGGRIRQSGGRWCGEGEALRGSRESLTLHSNQAALWENPEPSPQPQSSGSLLVRAGPSLAPPTCSGQTRRHLLPSFSHRGGLPSCTLLQRFWHFTPPPRILRVSLDRRGRQ